MLILKNFFHENPVKSSFLYFIFLTINFMIGIRILEKNNPYRDFRDLFNCFYFSVITLTTVGYGDFTPINPMGRLFSLIMMILGILNLNMINYCVVNNLELNCAEK